MAAEMGMRLITRMPRVEHDPARIGLFHVQYTINEPWDQQDQDEMGDWLATNCTKNYIFIRDISEILGGGCTPVGSRWTRYKKMRARNMVDPHETPDRCWHIKLSLQDDVLFRLRWLTDL